jgi:hypothetical protein
MTPKKFGFAVSQWTENFSSLNKKLPVAKSATGTVTET